MRRLVLVLALLTGCGRTITAVEPCTLARAGADTASAVAVNARGDTVSTVSVRWCVR